MADMTLKEAIERLRQPVPIKVKLEAQAEQGGTLKTPMEMILFFPGQWQQIRDRVLAAAESMVKLGEMEADITCYGKATKNREWVVWLPAPQPTQTRPPSSDPLGVRNKTHVPARQFRARSPQAAINAAWEQFKKERADAP